MSFNKRYISRENLSIYKNKKITELINFVTKPDCLIFRDSYSRTVCDIIIGAEDTSLIEKKLIEIGFYESK